ncbi:MAG: V-type ATP synthase subunit F [Bacilli bacterium]|jgi:V/A-type H+-transporting ATPase subunit F|nr:V-type ATP synthase subunit F [Bacilli bacterium]
MKLFCLSDNVDTEVGLRLVGIDGKVVHEKEEFLEELERILEDPSIAVVLITTKLVELCPDIISDLKLHEPNTLIVEIPDRHGAESVGVAVDQCISEAIGVKI